jgi:hypothetical protein
MKVQLEREKKLNTMKTFEEKQEEKQAKAKDSWIMIKVMEKYLLYFALFDFTCQIISQLPIITQNEFMTDVGFRKIWKEPTIGFTYINYIKTGNHGGVASL